MLFRSEPGMVTTSTGTVRGPWMITTSTVSLRESGDGAQDFWDALDLQAFEEVLALLIYGMVLFPNHDQLIDVNTVKNFISHNLVPTLLGDILHSLHSRTMKRRGTLMCCTPLFPRQFVLHLPQSVVKNEQGMRWSNRLMSLMHSNIHWCSRSLEDVTIIDHWGNSLMSLS